MRTAIHQKQPFCFSVDAVENGFGPWRISDALSKDWLILDFWYLCRETVLVKEAELVQSQG